VTATSDHLAPGSLDGAGLPSCFHLADRSAVAGRQQTMWWHVSQLGLLLVAAVSGTFSWHVSNGALDLAGLMAAAAFTIALLVLVWLTAADPQRLWYRGRAAAESVKTLAWRYAMGAEPFRIDNPNSDEMFLRQLGEIIYSMHDLDWSTPASGTEQITDTMRRMREEPLAVRRAVYEMGRIEDQRLWYVGRARRHNRSARFWSLVVFVATAAGLFLSFPKAFGRLGVDSLGLASAIAASVTAWTQLKQYRPLCTAYVLTAQELALVRSHVRSIEDEDAWAQAISQAEEAISREHTMWLARREM
jgi:hypothetical protein